MDLEKLKEELRSDEGLSLRPYKDSLGNLTIGYGHLIPPISSAPQSITMDQAEELLDRDVNRSATDTINVCEDFSVNFDALSEARQRVLVNMCFNLGTARLSIFRKMWDRLTDEDWLGASYEMVSSKWAKQVKGRATRLAAMMREG